MKTILITKLTHAKWSILFTLLTLIAGSLYVSQANAVPAFARQVGGECSTCHFQHYPKLNAFGRSFKASGFSMSNQKLLEGENLSIAPELNASFFVKTRVTDTDTDGGKGTLEFPNEAALVFGGRLAENMGGIVEMGDSILSYKISLTKQLESGMNVGTTLFATDALGAAYGFELLNTGAVRNHRPFERASKVSLGQQGLDLSGAATGMALHAQQSDWFAAMTFYLPDDNQTGATDMDPGGSLSSYLRAAWLPNVGGNDLGFGFGIISGNSQAHCADAAACGTVGVLTDFVTEAWFIDAQFQGELAGKALGAYFMYAEGGEDEGKADTVYVYNGGFADAPSGVGLDVEYAMMDDLNLLLTLGRNDNGDPNNDPATSVGIGAFWLLSQNITLQPMVEKFSGAQATKEHRYTVHLETAF